MEVEEWKVEKILNKRKIRGVEKYLVQWKGFTVKYNTWKREKDLENIKKVVVEFERRISAEVRKQEKLNIVEERDFGRRELLGKYMTKMLHK